MFYKLKDRWRRSRFDASVQGLLTMAPVAVDDSLGLVVLSQLQRKDLMLYLAAIKSFAGQVPVAEVHVLDDGSLGEGEKETLRRHVPGIVIRTIGQVRDPDLPAGGTWERLTEIARLSERSYVVQLDADTLSMGALPEVIDCVRHGRTFAIGTWDGQVLEAARDRSLRARALLLDGAEHVQVHAEAHFDRLDGADEIRYVRGCSGFAGFAASEGKLDFMKRHSARMVEFLGPIWSRWGSEQVMSNLLAANQPDAVVLPHPDYCDCTKIREGQTRFVHFIGTCRFQAGRYADEVNSFLAKEALCG